MAIDPVTWLVLSTGANVAGRVYGGLQARQRSEFDAQVAEDNARLRLLQANEDAMAIRRQAVIDFSREKARAAGAGVQFTGTPLALAAQNAAQAELEARQALYAGATQAAADRTQARQIRRTGRAQLISTVLGAGGDIASGGQQLQLARQQTLMMTTGRATVE
ncbi:MAG: hypothetical protein V2I24_09295 [Halieaceae bacterium]|jgi:hypothetical protein|nr:hypothetical protein [Halieaceae bacterium]